MAEYQYVKLEREGPVTIVTINRPETYNALHYPAHLEFAAIFDEFDQDPTQWVAIITGAGEKAFCAGNDLKYQAGGGEMKSVNGGFAGLTSRFNLTKPVIAAVNGLAMGGGFEIALASDIIVAAENAAFSLPEPRVGLVALAGGVHRLPRTIGLKRAMDMILTSRRVSAAEGKELGFVSHVVPASALLDTAKALAKEICVGSPMALRASKEAVARGLEGTLEAAIAGQRNYPAMQALFASQDIVEGPKAFAQKRAPRWAGS